jgi:hypothetical protein
MPDSGNRRSAGTRGQSEHRHVLDRILASMALAHDELDPLSHRLFEMLKAVGSEDSSEDGRDATRETEEPILPSRTPPAEG